MKKAKKYVILVINPGSTSTKTAVFRGGEEIFSEEIIHSNDEMARYPGIMGQEEFRRGLIEDILDRNGFSLKELDAVVGRGGVLRPMPSGTYTVSNRMIDDLKKGRYGHHASNLGAVLSRCLAGPLGIPSFIVDPVTVDEMEDVARVSGLPEIKRISIFHALNQKAVARLACRDLNREYALSRLIVVHMGGGISVGVHRNGRVIDVNNALNGDGPFAPTRTGGLPAGALVGLALSGVWSEDELSRKISSRGGMTAYLGTNDLKEVGKRIKSGDREAELVFDAMAYQVSREIGACAAVLAGAVDAVVLTGGMARDEEFIRRIKDRIAFIGRVLVYPGSREMEALASGAERVLCGKEEAGTY
ncbi:MAG: butyrate kinase [Candidatus Aminicenantes bacterium]|nr:butyrate kinase [Candidatus Aminicenantes bacterium]